MIAEDLEDEESPYGYCIICGEKLQENDYALICRECDLCSMRDEDEKPAEPKDNRDAAPLPPREEADGRLKCPGKHCTGILNKHTPTRCPDCLQPLEKAK